MTQANCIIISTINFNNIDIGRKYYPTQMNLNSHNQDQDMFENHKYEIIKLVTEYYLNVKLRYECKIDTI